MNLEKILAEIDPKKEYSPHDILKNGWIPWLSDYRSFYVILKKDMEGSNILQTATVRHEHSSYNRYYIQGKNLKSFIRRSVKQGKRPRTTVHTTP